MVETRGVGADDGGMRCEFVFACSCRNGRVWPSRLSRGFGNESCRVNGDEGAIGRRERRTRGNELKANVGRGAKRRLIGKDRKAVAVVVVPEARRFDVMTQEARRDTTRGSEAGRPVQRRRDQLTVVESGGGGRRGRELGQEDGS